MAKPNDNTEMHDFQVNFKFIAKNYALRNGSIVVRANTPEAARQAATEMLALREPTAKITKISLY